MSHQFSTKPWYDGMTAEQVDREWQRRWDDRTDEEAVFSTDHDQVGIVCSKDKAEAVVHALREIGVTSRLVVCPLAGLGCRLRVVVMTEAKRAEMHLIRLEDGDMAPSLLAALQPRGDS